MEFEVERMEPLFSNQKMTMNEFTEASRSSIRLPKKILLPIKETVFLGIDAGSTTTKAALVGEDGTLLYSFYHNNDGDPLGYYNCCNQGYL